MEIKKGKYIFGTVKVGERGQIVIPKEARDKFSIEPGDSLLVLGDENKGIAIVKEDLMKNFALKILEGMSYVKEKVKGEKNE
ncbi:AbrB family transcriptional regulator [Thermococci archaeon]|nr:MAG: AbrB family transcriptional regulator [Thermococci archaeon]